MKLNILEKNVKIKNMRKVSVIFIVLLISCTLKMDAIYPIHIYNESEVQYIGYYFATGGRYGSYYPDTLLPNNNTYVYNKNIKPKQHLQYDSWIKWDVTFKSLPKDTLSIFIFSSDTLNKYSWEEVRRDYKILKRYDLSIQDLELLDYKVYYPPIPAMSRMKIYPKYGRYKLYSFRTVKPQNSITYTATISEVL